LTFSTGLSSNSTGIVVALDINPFGDTYAYQVIFSIRDIANNNVPFTYEFHPPNATSFIQNNGTKFSNICPGPNLTSSNLSELHNLILLTTSKIIIRCMEQADS
jgi:hypothetical protein